LRSLALSKSGINKFRNHQFELKSSDFEDSIKSLPPGEWCLMQIGPGEVGVGFVNPLIEEKYTCAQIVSKIRIDEIKNFSIEEFVLEKINKAHSKRKKIHGYEKNSRLFYGVSDGLPGLIIDQFENASIIQINTAGMDRYREEIKKFVSSLMDSPAYLLDNAKYREKESLPTFTTDTLPDLHVLENGLNYKIRSEVLQKVGFYYDHRENRLQLMNVIPRMKAVPSRALDLFSYAGAWGMSALKAGVKEVHFVDQGNFNVEVEESLKLNGFESRGSFHRSDVFKYLDESVQKNNLFDLILCDPPAFCQKHASEASSLRGLQ
jgi:23S rRNA (cytosine1962-C5)-methyltransferase